MESGENSVHQEAPTERDGGYRLRGRGEHRPEGIEPAQQRWDCAWAVRTMVSAPRTQRLRCQLQHLWRCAPHTLIACRAPPTNSREPGVLSQPGPRVPVDKRGTQPRIHRRAAQPRRSQRNPCVPAPPSNALLLSQPAHTRAALSDSVSQRICAQCSTLLVPGQTSAGRLRRRGSTGASLAGSEAVVTCLVCGDVTHHVHLDAGAAVAAGRAEMAARASSQGAQPAPTTTPMRGASGGCGIPSSQTENLSKSQRCDRVAFQAAQSSVTDSPPVVQTEKEKPVYIQY